jgi:hypothetical protein
VLQHYCYLFWVLRQHSWRQSHPFGRGFKGNVKVMLTRQPILCHVYQHGAQHAAQSFLCQQIVADVIDGHSNKIPAVEVAGSMSVGETSFALARLSTPAGQLWTQSAESYPGQEPVR